MNMELRRCCQSCGLLSSIFRPPDAEIVTSLVLTSGWAAPPRRYSGPALDAAEFTEGVAPPFEHNKWGPALSRPNWTSLQSLLGACQQARPPSNKSSRLVICPGQQRIFTRLARPCPPVGWRSG